jgi:hypothetical protein
MTEMLESQDDFQIIARPERGQELFDAMAERIAPVLVVVAGLYNFSGIARMAARSSTIMAVLTRREAAEDQLDYLRDEMKAQGANGVVFDDAATLAEVVDYIRKVAA